KRDSGGERDSVLAEYGNRLRKDGADQTRECERCTGGESCSSGFPRGEEKTRNRQPLGQLVQQNRQEDQQPERVTHPKTAGDGDAVDEGVEHQPGQRREAYG